MRTWIAKRLRLLAERVDRETGPVAFAGYWYATLDGPKVVLTDGIQIHPEVPGCPLWYMAEDSERAWEAISRA